MNDIDKNLSEMLETEFEPTPKEVIVAQELMPTVVDDGVPNIARDIEFDYEFSRETHRELLEVGSDALDGIMQVAKASQHPRAYEVAANLLKIQSDMTDKLMTLHEKRKALLGEKAEPTQNINVDKAVFVGSTSELLRQIKQDQE